MWKRIGFILLILMVLVAVGAAIADVAAKFSMAEENRRILDNRLMGRPFKLGDKTYVAITHDAWGAYVCVDVSNHSDRIVMVPSAVANLVTSTTEP